MNPHVKQVINGHKGKFILYFVVHVSTYQICIIYYTYIVIHIKNTKVYTLCLVLLIQHIGNK